MDYYRAATGIFPFFKKATLVELKHSYDTYFEIPGKIRVDRIVFLHVYSLASLPMSKFCFRKKGGFHSYLSYSFLIYCGIS